MRRIAGRVIGHNHGPALTDGDLQSLKKGIAAAKAVPAAGENKKATAPVAIGALILGLGAFANAVLGSWGKHFGDGTYEPLKALLLSIVRKGFELVSLLHGAL